MAQAQFEEFMNDQLEAIAQSGLDTEDWITQHAEEFRTTWEAAHHE